jgi:ABC-type bacteriocin/lantibiotic exporter with double-glycine peptidase domain
MSSRRRWLAPEVVQTSSMDCGPAALKCVLDGFGIQANYGRLREACQTDVDGTSIDTLEDLAVQLGLEAEQILLPLDHLLCPEVNALPAVLIVARPDGATHFVVVWRRVGPYFQVMDPGVGRRWVRARDLADEALIHTVELTESQWLAWANARTFQAAQIARMHSLGFSFDEAKDLLELALSKSNGKGLAALDAAIRLVCDLINGDVLARGAKAVALVRTLALGVTAEQANALPDRYWMARPGPHSGSLLVRGVVAIRIGGARAGGVSSLDSPASAQSSDALEGLRGPEPSPFSFAIDLLRAEGARVHWLILVATSISAGALLLQALLLRSVIEFNVGATAPELVVGVLAVTIGFLATVVLQDWSLRSHVLGVSRRFELELRRRLLERLPRLPERFVRSRPVADSVERSHALHLTRDFPHQLWQLLQSTAGLTMTGIGVVWLMPTSWLLVLCTAAALTALPLLSKHLLAERDLRVRTHLGGLMRCHLDALQGAMAIRSQGAEAAVRAAHHNKLSVWIQARFAQLRLSVLVQATQSSIGAGLIALLLWQAHVEGAAAESMLLLAYWSMQILAHSGALANLLVHLPNATNVLARAIEPLHSPIETIDVQTPSTQAGHDESALMIEIRGVSTKVGGRTLLRDLNLDLRKGEHVAIVGQSGAGKSSLLRLLLGLNSATQGEILADGEVLSGARLERLREQTAWVDPTVQLWNASLLENLRYGRAQASLDRFSEAVDAAALRTLLEALPAGMGTLLGECGVRVSGGEGQRVRLARALLRDPVCLALLDEPFRGLDRRLRTELLSNARRWWASAALVCVTHDIEDTLSFDRVLVMEDGQIVESGAPAELLGQTGSRYAALLAGAREVAPRLGKESGWRRLRIHNGLLLNDEKAPTEAGDRTGPARVSDASFASDLGSTAQPHWETSALQSDISWTPDRCTHAVAALARASGMDIIEAQMPTSADSAQMSADACARHLQDCALALGLELTPVEIGNSWIFRGLTQARPSIVLTETAAGVKLTMVCSASKHRLQLVDRTGELRELSSLTLASELLDPADYSELEALRQALHVCGLDHSRVSSAVELANAQSSRRTRTQVFLLYRRSPRTRLGGALLDERVHWKLAGLLALHMARFSTLVCAWWLIGSAALQGALESSLILGWLLLMLTTTYLEALSRWREGVLGQRLGALLKQQLLDGALRLPLAKLRDSGPGQMMARVLESEVVEGEGIRGIILAVACLAELLLTAWILATVPGLGALPFAFAVWFLLCLVLGVVLHGRTRQWIEARVRISEGLTERLLGHATRVVQESVSHRHISEDRELAEYLRTAKAMDRSAAVITALISRGWLPVGLLSLVPALVSSQNLAASTLAAAVGALLLAGQALQKTNAALDHLSHLSLAWKGVSRLLHFADPSKAACTSPSLRQRPGRPLLDGSNLRYRPNGSPHDVVREWSISVYPGERVLLEGPSGSGKSTLAAVLAGVVPPDSGLLLLNGLDRRVVSAEAWRRQVCLVPQFHENHVLSETLAFNALLGSSYPGDARAVEAAREVLEELGMEPLLRKMPLGMAQMVGDSGWQLSHGERSRLFLARAVIASPQLVVLDESLTSLDPVTLRTVLRCLERRNCAVLLIAHP